MPKVKINLNKDVPTDETPVVPEVPVDETPVVPEEVKSPVKEDVKFPQVAGNGRYQVVQVGEGYVVYNPLACRVSGIITLTEANDIVRQQNQAAHIKG